MQTKEMRTQRFLTSLRDVVLLSLLIKENYWFVLLCWIIPFVLNFVLIFEKIKINQ